MKKIFIISFIGSLLLCIGLNNIHADRIEYFEYKTSYGKVPMREAPDANSKIIIWIPKDENVRVSEQQGYWVKVIYRVIDPWAVG